MDCPGGPGRAGEPSSPVRKSRPRPGGRRRPPLPGTAFAPDASAACGPGGAAVGGGGAGAIARGEGRPLGTAVKSSSRLRIIGPLARRSLGGPTLIRSFLAGSGGGGVGAGAAGRGGIGRGASCRRTAGGGRKTSSFRSMVDGSIFSGPKRGIGGWLTRIIRIVR